LDDCVRVERDADWARDLLQMQRLGRLRAVRELENVVGGAVRYVEIARCVDG
jgi:hypothetical protein